MSRKFNEVVARDLRLWLAKLLPQHEAALTGTDSFAEVMKNGVILCDFANHYRPGSISARQICRDPNMAFRQRENVGFFLREAKNLGIEDLYIFVTVDLFEEKNLPKVCDCLLEIQKKYDPTAYASVLSHAKQGSSMVNTSEPQTQATKEQPVIRPTGGRAKNPAVSTLVQDQELKQLLKYSPELASACKRWIEEVLEIQAPKDVDFEAWIKDGVVLCQLANKISPGSIPLKNIYSGTISHRQMENLNFYLRAITLYGLPGRDLFDVADLYESKNFNMVLMHFNALSNLCEGHPGWTGPVIANTSQAKNLLQDALLESEIKIDESFQENFSTEEKSLIDWANAFLATCKVHVPPIKNWSSLRSGIKIIRLLWGFLPGLETSGLQHVMEPKTLIDFMINATYIRMNLAVSVKEQDLASGNKDAYIKILTFMREENDFEWRFEQLVSTLDFEEIDEEYELSLEQTTTEIAIIQPEEPPSPSHRSHKRRSHSPGTPLSDTLRFEKKKSEHMNSQPKRDKSPRSKLHSSSGVPTKTETKKDGKPHVKSHYTSSEPIKLGDIKKEKSLSSKRSGKRSRSTSSSDPVNPKKEPSSDKLLDTTKSDPQKKPSKRLDASNPRESKPSSKKHEETPKTPQPDNASPVVPSRPSQPCLAKPILVVRPSERSFGITREASIRGPLDDAKKKQLAARMMCSHIAKEIASTEKTYSESLNLLVRTFIDPLDKDNLLDSQESEDIFANLRQITTFHKKFCGVIEAALKLQPLGNNMIQDVVLVAITNAFSTNLDEFQMYLEYLTNFPTSNFCLTFYRQSRPPLESLAQACIYELGGLTIADILIMPVQRLPRYIMLLNTLQKYTPPGPLNELLGSVQDTLQTSLLSMNSQIDPKRLPTLQSTLEKQKEILEWMKPYDVKLRRKLLLSSPTLKIKEIDPSSKKHHVKKHTHFSLFDDILVVASLPKKSLLGFSHEEAAVLTFLDAGVCSEVTKIDTKTFKFKLTSEGQSSKWTVETSSPTECDAWVTAMSK